MGRTASIAQLKSSLSEILAGVKAGEEVLVTERGRPVARIVPAEATPAGLTDLVRAGLVRPGKGPLPLEFWETARPADLRGGALGALLQEREEGR